MEKETIFGIIVGAVAGGAIGGFSVYGIMKKKYTKILNEQRDNYEKLLDDAEAFNIEDDVPDEFKRYKPNEDVSSDNDGKITENEKKVIKEKLKFNNSKTTEYAKMYSLSPSEVIDRQAEAGVPDPEEASNNESDEETSNIFKATQEAISNQNRPPVIISEEHFNDFLENNSLWDCETLFLYNDDTITTEDDKIIEGEELKLMLGDCLDKYGFRDSDEKIIYVQCFRLNTVYQITKFNKPFIKS